MRRVHAVLIAALILASAAPAFADIPTGDAAQLNQHSETAATTVKLTPITTNRQNADNGVHCAVTTPKKADIVNPTVQPQAGAGAAAIQSYSPSIPATPAAGATGGTLNSQTLFSSASAVVGGVNASQSTLAAASSNYQSTVPQVGAAPTVQGAFDMNSAARIQNGLTWNNVIGSANLWVTAINALNLAMTSDMSQVAIGMQAASAPASTIVAPVCPKGTIGSGTASDPCRTPSTCSTTPPGSAPDPACVTARYVDSDGDVLYFLAAVQSASQAGGSTPAAAAPGAPISTGDVAAALAKFTQE